MDNLPKYYDKATKFFLNEEVQKHKEALSQSAFDINLQQSTVAKLVGNPLPPAINLGADVYTDIEMFTAYRDIPGATTIFKSIDNTKMLGGSLWLKNTLSSPTANVKELTIRQNEIKEFRNIWKQQKTQTTTLLETLKATEPDVLWFFSATEEELQYLYEIVYFQSMVLFPLNRSPFALTAYNIYRIILSPLTGILSPIIYFVIPYLVLLFKYNISIGFFEYISFTVQSLIVGSDILSHLNGSFRFVKYISMFASGLFYFQNVFTSLDMSSLLWKLITKIYNHTNKAIEFLTSSKELLSIYGCFTDMVIPLKAHERCCFLLDHFGRQLNYFKACNRPKLCDVLKQVYEIDYKCCLMNLLQNNFELPDYVTGTTHPVISTHGLWHPSLAPHAIPNDLPKLQNTIITGPNAGGKSTLLKAVLTNLLLAQTIGVVSAKRLALTPFQFISSQISIPDCKGKESLFQAEMYRCKEKLDIVRTLPETNFMFIAMDEIFNSTNPLEGISGAFAVLKKLTEYPNIVVMITTHFLYLTKLKHHGFTCKKMEVVQQPDAPIKFPYKLKNGVSRQAVALELLAANGFDEDLIQTALEVKTRLSTACKNP